jgi:hypothetical protein
LLGFLPVYTMRTKQQIAVTRARWAAQVSARIAELERELGIKG